MSRQNLVVSCVSLSLFISFFLSNALSVALPTIGQIYGTLPHMNTLVVSSYTITLACFLLPASIIAKHYGNEKSFFLGLISCAFFTLTLAYAPNLMSFIILRSLQGMSAALFLAPAMSIIATHVKTQARYKAIAFSAGSTYLGVAASLGISGLAIDQNLLAYLLDGVGIVLFFTAIFAYFIPQSQSNTYERIPWIKLILYIGSIGLFLLSLNLLSSHYVAKYGLILSSLSFIIFIYQDYKDAKFSSWYHNNSLDDIYFKHDEDYALNINKHNPVHNIKSKHYKAYGVAHNYTNHLADNLFIISYQHLKKLWQNFTTTDSIYPNPPTINNLNGLVVLENDINNDDEQDFSSTYPPTLVSLGKQYALSYANKIDVLNEEGYQNQPLIFNLAPEEHENIISYTSCVNYSQLDNINNSISPLKSNLISKILHNFTFSSELYPVITPHNIEENSIEGQNYINFASYGEMPTLIEGTQDIILANQYMQEQSFQEIIAQNIIPHQKINTSFNFNNGHEIYPCPPLLIDNTIEYTEDMNDTTISSIYPQPPLIISKDKASKDFAIINLNPLTLNHHHHKAQRYALTSTNIPTLNPLTLELNQDDIADIEPHDYSEAQGYQECPPCLVAYKNIIALSHTPYAEDTIAQNCTQIKEQSLEDIQKLGVDIKINHSQSTYSSLLPIPLLIKHKTFAYCILSSLACHIAIMAEPALLASFLQYSLNLNAASAGLMVMLQPIIIGLTSMMLGRMIKHMCSYNLMILGLIILTTTLASFIYIDINSSLLSIIMRQILIGIGFGLFVTSNTAIVSLSVSKEHLNHAYALLQICRLFGYGLSFALMTNILCNMNNIDIGSLSHAYAFSNATKDILIISSLFGLLGVITTIFAYYNALKEKQKSKERKLQSYQAIN